MPAGERHNFAVTTLNLLAREIWLVSKGPSCSSLVWKHRTSWGDCIFLLAVPPLSKAILSPFCIESRGASTFHAWFPSWFSRQHLILKHLYTSLDLSLAGVPLLHSPSVPIPQCLHPLLHLLEAHCSHTSLKKDSCCCKRRLWELCFQTKFSRAHHYPWSLGGHPDSLAEFRKIPYRGDEQLGGGGCWCKILQSVKLANTSLQINPLLLMTLHCSFKVDVSLIKTKLLKLVQGRKHGLAAVCWVSYTYMSGLTSDIFKIMTLHWLTSFSVLNAVLD